MDFLLFAFGMLFGWFFGRIVKAARWIGKRIEGMLADWFCRRLFWR